MSVKSIYKYDKENRIEHHYIRDMGWICSYKYNKDFRKSYFNHFRINSNQITKDRLVNGKYVLISSLTKYGKIKIYTQYRDGKEHFIKMFNLKNKTIFLTKTLLSIGDSSIKETTFIKNNKEEKQIRITTLQDGKRNRTKK